MQEPFIIAELSANHNQDINIALRSIESIAKTGANSVKLQTYKPSCLTLPCKNDYFLIKDGLWKGSYLWDLYESAQMPWEWHGRLFSFARELGLVCFSSPFSVEGVEFLEKFDCPIYKIASFEVMHIPLLRAVAKTKKPVILSLGVAFDNEIEKALEILKDNESIILLYCISAYPSRIEDVKLGNISQIKEKWKKYNIKVGISDHTKGITVPAIATLCGASAIEKHFILNRNIDSADKEFSLDFNEFKNMVSSVKEASILAKDLSVSPFSTVDNIDKEKPKKGREFARSLFVSKNVKNGDTISMENVACIRPSSGFEAIKIDDVMGLRFARDIEAGAPLRLSDIN